MVVLHTPSQFCHAVQRDTPGYKDPLDSLTDINICPSTCRNQRRHHTPVIIRIFIDLGAGAIVGSDRIVVGFTTTYAISAYHHQSCEFECHSWRGVIDTTLCDKVCQ